MENLSGHVVTLANSIIGVSILAMPYCFKQCGIILSILILLISSVISRLACHFLLKSAILARRKTFEFLAFHIFGALGKFAIEIGLIGFLLGTCVAFFVVMGDLGPEIISQMSGVTVGGTLRTSTLVALAVFCILPLGLLKNLDSLNGISVATISFYCCLVLKVIIDALPHIFLGDWLPEVILWRPGGILQCLPIFSMALFCQTQIFEIYQAVPNNSLEKMNHLIRMAVYSCTCVYIFVGTFGYIAYVKAPFTGNILLSFKPSLMSDVIKMGFVLSLAFSFPLVIFPCRASLYSLLYKGANFQTSYSGLHEAAPTNYIPENKFQLLTVIIVFTSLIIGILIPNIELVLGLVGSTIGVMICVIFPVTCFICISPKNTNERILAQIMLFVGVIVMVLGTYANLYAMEEATFFPVEIQTIKPEIPKILQENANLVFDIPTTLAAPVPMKQPEETLVKETVKSDVGETEKKSVETQAKEKIVEKPPELNLSPQKEDKQEPVVEPVQPIETKPDPVLEPILPKEADKHGPIVESFLNKESEKQGPVIEPVLPKEESKVQVPEPNQEAKKKELNSKIKGAVMDTKEQVDAEAIQKEETELKEAAKEKAKEKNPGQLLIDTIQKQNEVQKEIVEQHKKLIEVLKKQDDIDKVNEEKVKAVKEIENIAKKAIESISAQDPKPKNKTEEKRTVLEPLPLVLAKLASKAENREKEESKAVGRDILENREKRDTERINRLSKAVKEVCDESGKSVTEKPLIKMLCTLSDTDLMQLDSEMLEKLESGHLKAQSQL